MPTTVSHGIVALVFGEIFIHSKSTKFWILSFLCSILPDIDVVTFLFDLPINQVFGHRGFSHSIIFVFIVALLVIYFGYKEIRQFSKEWWIFFSYFFFLGFTHIVLDAMTSGGQGVGFFIPFDTTRYLFPFRPIRVSPYRLMQFFGSEGKRILISEMFWIWVPAALLLIIIRFVRLNRSKN